MFLPYLFPPVFRGLFTRLFCCWQGVGLLFAGMGSPALGFAQSAVVSVFPEKSEIGDTFMVKILVSGTQVMPGRVNFHAWTSALPAENLLRRGDWQRSGAQWVQECTFIAFDSIRTELSPLFVPTHLGDSLRTNPLALYIFPTALPQGDSAEAAPIRDIRREAARWSDHWPWAAGLGASLLLLLWRMRRRPRKTAPSAPVPAVAPAVSVLPPRQAALEALQALAVRQLWVKRDPDTHFTAISHILRSYIEARYQFPALESTTREILKYLHPLLPVPALMTSLQTLLQGADAVKYALSAPAEGRYEEAIDQARKVVETLG